jgi:SagB-type dehydrogenase family enzyme
MLANLLAASAARKLPAKVVLGFVDGAVSDLLSLDRQREAPLSLVALGNTPKQSIRSFPAIEPLALETEPLSTREVEYPAMRSMHEASSLASAEEVASWRNEAQARGMKDEGGNEPQGGRLKDESAERLFILQPFNDDEMPQDNIEEAIIRRGSTREFSRDAITFAQLSTMIDRATRGMPFDCLNAGESLNDLYLIVNAVDGLPPGAYVYQRAARALELLKEGDFRREAGYLGLGQAIPADCCVNVYFLTDLQRVLQRFGNRGYRAAQLEASIMGGKLYLAAYAQRLGASGLTFFDDDVVKFFSPHAAGKSVMFLIAIGKSVKLKG